jgi:lactoylglutathione lyase
MQGITSIGHVAVRVADIDRSLAFYTGRLGFPEMLRLHRDDGSLWLVYLRITDAQYLELFPDAKGERAPPEDANGLNHLCLTVDDIEAAVARLAERGVPLLRPLKRGADGNRQAWIEDPDGNRIELMEMAPDGLQARAVQRLRQSAGGAG